MRVRNALLLHAICFALAVFAAALVYIFSPPWLAGTMRVVAAYDAAAAALLTWYWAIAVRTEPQEAQRSAAVEDPGRNIVFVVVLVAVGFGLFAAIVILGRGAHGQAPATIAYAIALVAVVLGWLLIHTIFLFRYARLYYAGGGLLFPGSEPPNDLDFAYFSFVLGMTFQVSDVQVTDHRVRRLALAHGVISFAYNTTILALGVNVVSNLLHS